MAIDLCSEMSPRISFSNDLGQADVVPIEQYKSQHGPLLLDSNSDFEFGININSFEHESSSADELFSDGLIRPIQIQKRISTSKPLAASLPPLPHPPSSAENSKKGRLKEMAAVVASFESEEKPQSKSFWSFKRSCSLNGENSCKRSLIFSLPLLSRSNSTGSAPNSKRTMSSSSKDNQKQSSHKLPSIPLAKSSSSSSTTTSFYTYPMPQKLSLKKNYGGSYSQGVRISPVLNVPPPYISKGTANLLGLGSFFGDGKDKKKKKNK